MSFIIFNNECVYGVVAQVAEGGDSGSSGLFQSEAVRDRRRGQGGAKRRVWEGSVSIPLS